MENHTGGSGRKRGLTKHSVEDQALDQIAKEKIVGLGNAKPTKEDDEAAVEGRSRSESPIDDSLNNNLEDNCLVDEKTDGKRKRHRSKKKKKTKKLEDCRNEEPEVISSHEELTLNSKENDEDSETSKPSVSKPCFDDLSALEKSHGTSSTSQDISFLDASDCRSEKNSDNSDLRTNNNENYVKLEENKIRNDEDGENSKNDVDFDEFWAEFDAEEGKLRKESQPIVEPLEETVRNNEDEGSIEKRLIDNSPAFQEDGSVDNILVENSNSIELENEIQDFWADVDDNLHLNAPKENDHTNEKTMTLTIDDGIDDIWADREDDAPLSRPRGKYRASNESSEELSEASKMYDPEDENLQNEISENSKYKDQINKLSDNSITEEGNSSATTSDEQVSHVEPSLGKFDNVDQTTVDDFWGDIEDDPQPPVFQIRKSIDETTAIDITENPMPEAADENVTDIPNGEEQSDESEMTSSGETIPSDPKMGQNSEEIMASDVVGGIEAVEGTDTTLSGESLSCGDIAELPPKSNANSSLGLFESETATETPIDSEHSDDESGNDEDKNSSEAEELEKKNSSKNSNGVSQIPIPPPWVEPLWAEELGESKTSITDRDVKEKHRRNFESALRSIEAPPRRRSVLLPDGRERILRDELQNRVSESSADGEASEDDGIMDFLGKENDRAEARLAARRQARVEAREIRMREVERLQKEQQEEGGDRVFDLHATPRSSTVSPRERPTSNNSYHSSRRSSEDSMEDGGLSLRDIRHELKEVEEKFRKSMIANAQLDNEKAALSYQVELLKDKLEDLEEAHSQLGREHRERCREHEALKRATIKLKEDLNMCRQCLEEREMLIADYGLVIVGGEVDDKGELTPRTLVSKQSAEILDSAGEGSLDVRLKSLAKEKNELLDEVRHLKLELEEERNRRRNDKMLSNGPIGDEIQQTLNDYRFRLQKADQETSTLQATVARLESQVIRYKSAAETSEKAEDELKIEKRKLQREHRESIARIEELETSNSHLQRRMDKLKNAKSTLLKEL